MKIPWARTCINFFCMQLSSLVSARFFFNLIRLAATQVTYRPVPECQVPGFQSCILHFHPGTSCWLLSFAFFYHQSSPDCHVQFSSFSSLHRSRTSASLLQKCWNKTEAWILWVFTIDKKIKTIPKNRTVLTISHDSASQKLSLARALGWGLAHDLHLLTLTQQMEKEPKRRVFWSQSSSTIATAVSKLVVNY